MCTQRVCTGVYANNVKTGMYICVHICVNMYIRMFTKGGVVHGWQVRPWPDILRIILESLSYSVFTGRGWDRAPQCLAHLPKTLMDPKDLEQEGSCRRVRFVLWVMEHLKCGGGFAPPGTEGFTEVSGIEGLGTQPSNESFQSLRPGPPELWREVGDCERKEERALDFSLD